MKALALVCGFLMLYAFMSLASAPEYTPPQPWPEYADARTQRLARALVAWALGFIGVIALALHSC
jgi:hypothetical protein